MRLSTITLKEGEKINIPVFCSIIRLKIFNGFRKLGLDHAYTIVIKLFEFRERLFMRNNHIKRENPSTKTTK